MRVAISSQSFRPLVRVGEMTQLEIISQAKEMGFHAIEFASFIPPKGETPLDFAPRVVEECERNNMEIVNYAVHSDFLTGSGGDWKAEVKRLEDEIRVARILGVSSLRHHASQGYPPEYRGPSGFEDALPVLIKACRAVTERAADYGIRTMIENRGFFCQDSERVEKLANGVNHPNFGLLLDIGNFLCADEDPARALGRLMPLAFHIHVKDYHVKSGVQPWPGTGWFQSRSGNYLRGAILGHGDVPVLQCLRVIKRDGYDGVISLEFEGLESPVLAASIGLANLRRFLQDIWRGPDAPCRNLVPPQNDPEK